MSESEWFAGLRRDQLIRWGVPSDMIEKVMAPAEEKVRDLLEQMKREAEQ